MPRRVMVLAMLSVCACLPARAQYVQWYDGRAWAQQGQQRGQQENRPDPRYKGGERQGDEGGRRGSLSPDERRELNRDLQRANREIYRKGRDGR